DSHKDATAVAEVSLKSAYDGSEYADVERSLLGRPGVAAAHLDRTRGVAHVTYDPLVTTPERLEAQFRRCGDPCDCQGRLGSAAQVGHPRVGTREYAGMEHAGMEHGVAGHAEHAGHGAAMVADTLIALGILVSYLYSVAATFVFAGEVFYDAAAMLTSFSLA